ncbi:MAG: hypothetical protein ACK5LC_01160 [Coprobacillaceae bacterium]
MTMPLFLKEGEVLITKEDQSTANFDCSAGINVLSFNVTDTKVETIKLGDSEVNIEITDSAINTSASLEIKKQRVN